jgi:signal transduction histidine kinase
MATDLQENAAASAKAFRSQILDGQIRTTEAQIREVLELSKGEEINVLNKDFSRIYVPYDSAFTAPTCKTIGRPCVEWYARQAEILYPIYFDEEAKHLYGYLFLSRTMHLDWAFSFIVFSIFALGYLVLLFGVTRITKVATDILAKNLEDWSQVIVNNPKNTAALSKTPFTELANMRAAIEGLNEKIEGFETKAAESAKLLILRGIAHDIVGPLAQTQLFLATLKKKTEFEPDYAPLIDKAMGSVDDVAEVASQVKMLKSSPDPNDHIDLATEIQLEVETLRGSEAVREKEIELKFESDSSIRVEASLSRPELRRILQNLIRNSADASMARSKIEVGVRTDGDQAVLSVRDHGHGIPEDLQEKVFQPDFTMKPGTGTGLGLAIVRFIAKSRNGAAKLASSNSGTLVEVNFPIFRKEGVSSCPTKS